MVPALYGPTTTSPLPSTNVTVGTWTLPVGAIGWQASINTVALDTGQTNLRVQLLCLTTGNASIACVTGGTAGEVTNITPAQFPWTKVYTPLDSTVAKVRVTWC